MVTQTCQSIVRVFTFTNNKKTFLKMKEYVGIHVYIKTEKAQEQDGFGNKMKYHFHITTVHKYRFIVLKFTIKSHDFFGTCFLLSYTEPLMSISHLPDFLHRI